MDDEQLDLTGKFYGQNPTETEKESGTEIELREQGPLKPGKAGHEMLRIFRRTYGGDHNAMTAYEASYLATADNHAPRREARRLYMRGFLVKEGTLPNPARNGRPRVDAFRMTGAGFLELQRLDALEDE